MDNVLKEELGPLYVGVPGFYEAFFGEIAGLKAVAEAGFKKCKDENNLLYREAGGWCEWPKGANEDEVLKWFAKLVNTLVEFAEDHGWTPRTRRKLLALPNQPLKGSTAERKLDIGFMNDRRASEDPPKRHWSDILVPGELKSNPGYDIPSKAWIDLGGDMRGRCSPLKILVALSRASHFADLPCGCGSLIGWEASCLRRLISTKTGSSLSRRYWDT